MKIKKSRGLRPFNINPLFEIKLYKFTLSIYPKDLLFNTYDLIHIHIHDTTNPCCSIVDPLVPPNRLLFSTNNSKIQILEWENGNGVAIRIFSKGVLLKNKRSLNNLLRSLWSFWYLFSNPQGVIREVFIGKIHKSFGISSFQIRVWLKFIQNMFLNSTGLTWLLEWTLTA